MSKLTAVLREALRKAMASVGSSFTLLCFLMGTSRFKTSVWVTLCRCDKTCNQNDFWKKSVFWLRVPEGKSVMVGVPWQPAAGARN